MKYLFLFILLVFWGHPFIAHTQPSSTPLRISLEERAPYAYQDSDGTPTGLYIELLDTLFCGSHIQHTIVLVDSLSSRLETTDSLYNYDCTLIAQNRLATPQRPRFSSILLFCSNSLLIHRKSFTISSLNDFAHYRIGVPQKAYFKANMIKLGIIFPDSNLYTYDRLEDAFDMLNKNQCDFALVDQLQYYWHFKDQAKPPYYIDHLASQQFLSSIYISEQLASHDYIQSWLTHRVSTLGGTNTINQIYERWFFDTHPHDIAHLENRLEELLKVLSLLILLFVLTIFFLRRRQSIQIRSFKEFQDILMGLPQGVDMYINGSSVPIFQNTKSQAIDIAQSEDPQSVCIKQEQIYFRYKHTRVKIVIKMDFTDLELARQKANSSSRLKTKFLANTSHDLRSPLNAIVGFADLISTCEDPDCMAGYAQIIESNTTYLLHLIDEIIQLSKIQTDILDDKPRQPYDLYIALDTVVKEQRFFLNRRGKEAVQLHLSTNFRKLIVLAYPARVHRVLTNLMSNAAKYTDEGYIRIDARFEENNETIYIDISDTGQGMSDKTLNSLFTDSDVHDRNRKDSFGLGLAICKAILDKVHATIEVHSVQGEGTTVSIVYKPKICEYTLIGPHQ